jgi:uncharacterized protein
MRWFIKATAVFLAGMATIAYACSATAQQRDFDDRAKINVSGESVVYVQPNKILISLGIETWDAKIDAAKRKNDEIVKAAIAAIEKCGLDKKAIQMDHLSVEPTYDTREHHWLRALDGYVVRNAFVVTITDVSLLDRVVSDSLKSGVNYIHNVDFQTTELRKYRDQARQLALKAAREKAKDMAAVYGQGIGKPLQINENAGYGGSSYHYWSWCGWGGGGRDYGMSQNSMVNAPGSSGSGEDSVVVGKIAIRANVNVVFELKDE